MLRVQFQGNGNLMRIEGRLVGSFAEDTRSLITAKNIPAGLVVDLSELNYCDALGDEVLSWLGRLGCRFIAGNTYSSFICMTLSLPMAHSGARDTLASD